LVLQVECEGSGLLGLRICRLVSAHGTSFCCIGI
jgi:hypothetical protein